jgi:hypothetical protein
MEFNMFRFFKSLAQISFFIFSFSVLASDGWRIAGSGESRELVVQVGELDRSNPLEYMGSPTKSSEGACFDVVPFDPKRYRGPYASGVNQALPPGYIGSPTGSSAQQQGEGSPRRSFGEAPATPTQNVDLNAFRFPPDSSGELDRSNPLSAGPNPCLGNPRYSGNKAVLRGQTEVLPSGHHNSMSRRFPKVPVQGDQAPYLSDRGLNSDEDQGPSSEGGACSDIAPFESERCRGPYADVPNQTIDSPVGPSPQKKERGPSWGSLSEHLPAPLQGHKFTSDEDQGSPLGMVASPGNSPEDQKWPDFRDEKELKAFAEEADQKQPSCCERFVQWVSRCCCSQKRRAP